jgi:hypothetical protein
VDDDSTYNPQVTATVTNEYFLSVAEKLSHKATTTTTTTTIIIIINFLFFFFKHPVALIYSSQTVPPSTRQPIYFLLYTFTFRPYMAIVKCSFAKTVSLCVISCCFYHI